MKIFFLISILLSVLPGCEREPEFGKAAFAASRPCTEVIFRCLPESIDPAYEQRWDVFKMTDREQLDPHDSAAQAEARLLSFMDEIIELIEDSNPGFWQGVDKKTRYAWMNDAFDKADELGFGNSKGEGIQCIEILARMGLNFTIDPANKKISTFLLESPLATSGRLVQTRDYIDWVLLDRELNSVGREISLWGLREILDVMPLPDPMPPELPTQR